MSRGKKHSAEVIIAKLGEADEGLPLGGTWIEHHAGGLRSAAPVNRFDNRRGL